MDENRVYFPLYGFTVDSDDLPIILSDTLTIRDASHEEKSLFGKIQPNHWSEMASVKDMEPFRCGSVHDLFVPILNEIGPNNSGHWVLERALLLLHENIRFGDMYIYTPDGKIRKRQGNPSNQIHIQMKGQTSAERREHNSSLPHLGKTQVPAGTV